MTSGANRRDRTTSDFVATRLSYEILELFCTQCLPLIYHNIVGFCNGLVSVHDNYDMNIILWNPTTTEAKLVPVSNRPHLSTGYSSIFNGIRFGFSNLSGMILFLFVSNTAPYKFSSKTNYWMNCRMLYKT